MEVQVDGQGNFAVQGQPKHLLELLGAVTDFLRDQGRAMVTMTIDGVAVMPDELAEFSANRPLDGIDAIAVTSRPIADLVDESLQELRASIPELATACRGLAEVFHSEVPEEGYDPFHELAGIWSHVKQREAMVANILGIDLSQLSIGDKPVHQVHTELNACLEEAAQAITSGDCVLLGDLLEYELAPRAEEEQRIVALLQEKAAATTR